MEPTLYKRQFLLKRMEVLMNKSKYTFPAADTNMINLERLAKGKLDDEESGEMSGFGSEIQLSEQDKFFSFRQRPLGFTQQCGTNSARKLDITQCLKEIYQDNNYIVETQCEFSLSEDIIPDQICDEVEDKDTDG